MRYLSKFKVSLIINLILIVLLLYYGSVIKENTTKCSRVNHSGTSMPMIYVITPTYARHVQKAELTRLSHTLMLVPNVHWILVEDADSPTEMVSKFLIDIQNYAKIPFTHLNVLTPPEYKSLPSDPNWIKPRGVLQRNVALNWLRENHDSIDRNGVVYFADDDNTYDLKLFEEMRQTIKVSVWPVALVGGLLVEKPIVKDSKVIGWNSLWKPKRQFPIDMSGFAIKLKLLLDNPNALFSLRVARGLQETHLLHQLIDNISELEPKANECTRVFVWHTRTEIPKLKQEIKLKIPSNYKIEI